MSLYLYCYVFIILLLTLHVFTIMYFLHHFYMCVIHHFVFIDLYIESRGLAII